MKTNQKSVTAGVLAGVLLAPVPALAVDRDAPTDVDAIKAQLEELQSQLVELEDRQAERDAEESTDGIRFGGAVRLTYAWTDWDDQQKDRGGDFDLEHVGINMDGSIGDVILSAQWRRYNDFQAIRYAWVGYEFTDRTHMELGITQVPFGILPFSSHSFWLGGTYYVGYEDDYDAGIKLEHRPNDDWTFHAAFFKNSEYTSGRSERYSFDLVTDGDDDQQNLETNQVNLRGERHLVTSDDFRVDLGLSLQGGQMYNRITERNGSRFAGAVHADAYYRDWNFQLQGVRYQYNPENPDGVSSSFVQKGAFGFPFMMAARANVYTANIARSFDMNLGPVSNVTCYNDFTYIDPTVKDSSNSIQNVTGCAITAGGVLAYVDWIAGRNMWFVNGDGIGLDGDSAGSWNSRFNFNVGYYF
ncbi:hypothetical protein M0534_10890 [Methylonatrum kenyense]|uniref:hypothetical protein n=1 Tax=Methylonatrum kenyense TaxID=455253 RepID=UPI0020C12752|nr:hypothetical protein [Methylonatrum kenyense]MCK8516823.1 hypothetical protein [Methylonatrum kenyense]